MSEISSFFHYLRSVLYDSLILPFHFLRKSKSKQKPIVASAPVSPSSSSKAEKIISKMGSKESTAAFPTTEPAMKISVRVTDDAVYNFRVVGAYCDQ